MQYNSHRGDNRVSGVVGRIYSCIIIIGFLLAGSNLIISAGDCARYAGIDLRNRIVGARAYIHGMDPYMWSWDPSMGEQFLDPIQRYPGPSRNTVPPTHLLFYIPYSLFSYKTARVLWFCTEWLLMILSCYFLVQSYKASRNRLPLLVIILYLFASSYFWRLHAERGQYYVVILFMFSLSLFMIRREGQRSWHPGIPLGILVLFRPTWIFALIVLLLSRHKKIAVAGIVTCAIGILLTLPGDGPGIWKRYLINARELEFSANDRTYLYRKLGPRISVPMVAEGVEFNRYIGHRSSIQTFGALMAQFKTELISGGISIAEGIDPVKTNDIVLFIYILCFLYLVRFGRKRHFTLYQALFAASVLSIDLDFFLPNRWPYVDILFLIPLALILPFLLSRGCPIYLSVMLLSGPIISRVDLFDGYLATALHELLFLISINLILFLFLLKRRGRRVTRLALA